MALQNYTYMLGVENLYFYFLIAGQYLNAQSQDVEDRGKEMEIGWTLFRGHVQMMKMDDDSIFLEQFGMLFGR